MESSKYRSHITINFIIGFSMILCVIGSRFMFCTYASIALMVAFMVYLAYYYTGIYLKYLYFIFAVLAATTGCAIIELSRVNLYELSTSSSFVGSLPLMIFSYWLFITTLIIHDKWMNNRITLRMENNAIRLNDYLSTDDGNKKNSIVFILSIIALCLACFVFMKVIKNPSFLLGIDRFTYMQTFSYGRLYSISLQILNYLIVPCIVAFVVYKKKIGLAAIIIYCLYAFWVGNKFGIFFVVVCYFTMIYHQMVLEKIRQNIGILIRVAVVMAILIVVATFAISITGGNIATVYLQSRIAQQGQLWWRVYELTSDMHIGEFSREISGLLNGSPNTRENVGADYGIYHIMYYTSPENIIDSKLASGSRYTESGFAAMYYYFGVAGCVGFAIICGMLASWIVNSMLYFLRFNQFVRVFICVHLYMAIKTMMSSFLFFGFFSLFALVGYAVLLVGRGKLFRYKSIQL